MLPVYACIPCGAVIMCWCTWPAMHEVTSRYEVKAKKKTACIREIAADIAARFLSRQGRVQSGEPFPPLGCGNKHWIRQFHGAGQCMQLSACVRLLLYAKAACIVCRQSVSNAVVCPCAGIVYCFSRNECEKVAAELQDALRTEHGLNHGQRRAEVRHGLPTPRQARADCLLNCLVRPTALRS